MSDIVIKKNSALNISVSLFYTSAFTAAFALLILYSGEAAGAVRSGIELCASGVIPSLFPMMFLSQYIVKSGAAEYAGSLLNKPTRLLFGLPGVCGVALLTAFVGGYPAGARAAETLVSDGKITRAEGERLAYFAFCSGPGFAIGMIGATVYKNKSVGLLILTAQVFSCIIIGIAYRLFSKCSPQTIRRNENCAVSRSPDAFIQSAADTAQTLLNMCSFIILFQVITALLGSTGVNAALGKMTECIGLGDFGKILLPCLSEVTGGTVLSVTAGIPFTAFVAGFGGLSVHFQNFALFRHIRPKKTLYLLTRLIQGIICGIFVRLALKLPCFSHESLPSSAKVLNGIPSDFSRVSTGFGCLMLIMCLMSVICLPSQKETTQL